MRCPGGAHFHDPDGASTTRRPSGWVGTMANSGRVVNLREKAVTSVRYCPFRSGWPVVSDHWPVLLAVVTPPSLMITGCAGGRRASRMIEPGAAVPENSG